MQEESIWKFLNPGVAGVVKTRAGRLQQAMVQTINQPVQSIRLQRLPFAGVINLIDQRGAAHAGGYKAVFPTSYILSQGKDRGRACLFHHQLSSAHPFHLRKI